MSLASLFGFGKPSLSPAPYDNFWYNQIGTQTASGVRVDEQIALNYSVCWAATRLLAGTAGWLPCNLHKRRRGGGADVASAHRVHRLIHDRPNNDMGAMMFRSRGVNHQVNWGNAYAEIVRNTGGIPERLEPIHPSRIPPQNVKRENGRLVYWVKPPNGGSPEKVLQENMFHVPSILSDDGIVGKGVIAHAREAIGKAMGTQSRGASALKNGGAPPLALKRAKFKDKAELEDFRRQLHETHGGPENAGKWLLLPGDAEVQMLGFSLKDSEFIESQHFDIEEIARWYGVPPHLVGHLLRATFNNIEELGIAFVKYGLIHWLKLWEQEIWIKLLTDAEKEDYYAKFNVDALERGNLANRTEAGVKKFFNGLWTLNQWAEQEDMNPIEETTIVDGQSVSLGDVHFVQQAMIPLASAAKGPAKPPAPPAGEEKPPEDAPAKEPPAEEPEDDGLSALRDQLTECITTVNSLRAGVEGTRNVMAAVEAARAAQQALAGAMLNDVMARMVSLEVNAVKRVAEKPSRFDARLREFYGKHAETMTRSLASPLAAYLTAKGDGRAAAEVVRTIAAEHVAESMSQLDALTSCQADELSAKVAECVDKWHEERATVTL